MSLRDHLTAIYREHGRLSPELTVAAATPKDHPLHDRFEWNNREAGHQYRLIQAAELIRSVKVVYRDDGNEQRTVRAFHAVRSSDDEPGTYRHIDDIVADEKASALVLQDMEREWKSLHRRYGHMEEFLSVVKADIAV